MSTGTHPRCWRSPTHSRICVEITSILAAALVLLGACIPGTTRVMAFAPRFSHSPPHHPTVPKTAKISSTWVTRTTTSRIILKPTVLSLLPPLESIPIVAPQTVLDWTQSGGLLHMMTTDEGMRQLLAWPTEGLSSLSGLSSSQLASPASLSSSVLLTDTAIAPPTGWWADYLNIFKSTLLGVHSVITPPLQSVGVQNTWGIAITIFTAMVRTLLIPISIQQSQSVEKTKALRPYITQIRSKYKANTDAQNRAIAKLYEDAKQNPLAGCLMSLLQLPIFLGLYRGVRLLAMDGELEEPFLWIPSLEGPVLPPNYNGLDWIVQGWTTSPSLVPPLGWELTLSFLVMPLVLVVLQSLTMTFLSPTVDDNMTEEEKKTIENSGVILKFLPLLIGFFSLQVPAGLTIYWFTSNIFTLSQSLAVKAYYKAYPPKIALPDYWDSAVLDGTKEYEDMTPDERRQMALAGLKVGPSLDDWVDEGRYLHCFIERESQLLQKQQQQQQQERASGTDLNGDHIPLTTLPVDLQEWVRQASTGHHRPVVSTSGTSATSPTTHEPLAACSTTTATTTTAVQEPSANYKQ